MYTSRMDTYLFSAFLITDILFCSCLKMDFKREYFFKGKVLFCAELSCFENVTGKPEITSLLNISLSRNSGSYGKIVLASISGSDLKVRANRDFESDTDGKMSKYYTELILHFSNASDCSSNSYTCEVHFTNKTGHIGRIEKITDPPSKQRDKNSIVLMKLKAKTANYEKTIEKLGDMLKSFEDQDKPNNPELVMTLQTSHYGENENNDDFAQLPSTSNTNSHQRMQLSKVMDQLEAKLTNLSVEFYEKINKLETALKTKLSSFLNEMTTIKSHNKSVSEAIANLTESIKIVNENKNTLENIEADLLIMTNTVRDKADKTEVKKITILSESLNKTFQELKNDLGENPFLIINIDKCKKNHNLRLADHMVVRLDKHKVTLCDTTTEGGGWVVIQRRVVGDITFIRTWDEYKTGFGAIGGDFWIGNDWISNLTLMGYTEMRIDMSYQGSNYYAEYSNFKVDNEANAYRMTYTAFIGNTSDDLSNHNGMKFSTIDRDNDIGEGNCASSYKGGWWYNNCHTVGLNGIWGSVEKGLILKWNDITGSTSSLDFAEMKVRKP